LTDLSRLQIRLPILCNPDYFAGSSARSSIQPSISKVQVQHAQQYVEQDTDNLRGGTAAPNRRQGQETDQIVQAALKTSDVFDAV
jgi:hypothetical protein